MEYFVPHCGWEVLSISFAYIVPSHVSSNDFDKTITAISVIPFWHAILWFEWREDARALCGNLTR